MSKPSKKKRGSGASASTPAPAEPRFLSEQEFDQVFEEDFSDRFPETTRADIIQQVAFTLITAGIGLWGLLTQGWGVLELGILVAVEFLVVWTLNWVSLAFLPVAMSKDCKKGIAFWKAVAIGAAALGMAAVAVFYDVKGRGPWPELAAGCSQAAHFLVEHGLKWPLVAVTVTLFGQFGGDVLRWRQRGGLFIYWSGVFVIIRFFCILFFGVFFMGFLGGVITSLGRTGTAMAAWALLLLVDLLLVWMPIEIRRKIKEEKTGRGGRRLP